MRIVRLIQITAILFLTGACNKTHNVNEDQKVYFQVDYINYAWEYQHKGFIIDSKGNVLTYENPADWNFPDDNLYLSNEEIAENLSQCSNSGQKVPVDELGKFASYISNIASSKVTAVRNTGNDSGSIRYICYDYHADREIYKGFLIRMEGDTSCENLNFYSKKVVAWLKGIDQTSVPQ